MKQFTEKNIDTIIKNFDFNKVHKIMTLLGWTWAMGDEHKTQVPSIEEMKILARKLLSEVIKQDCYSVGTGGFFAYIVGDNEIGLRFELENCWDFVE